MFTQLNKLIACELYYRTCDINEKLQDKHTLFLMLFHVMAEGICGPLTYLLGSHHFCCLYSKAPADNTALPITANKSAISPCWCK